MEPANSDRSPPRELTVLAIVFGVVIAIVFGAANAYLGLRAGMTITASIPAAVISMAIFRALRRRGALLENNMVQTIGSAGESVAAGVIFTIPALFLWGLEPRLLEISILASLGGLLGVLMMIPLRRRLIVEEHETLPYPEGTACAEVLRAGDEGGTRAHTVFAGLGVGAVYKGLAEGIRVFPASVSAHLPVAPNAVLAMDALPSLLAVGYIIGARISALVFAGGVLGWLVFIPVISFFGQNLETVLPPGEMPISEMDADHVWTYYLRYIGAGAVAFGGLVSLIKSVPLLWRSVGAMWRTAAAGRSGAAIAREERDLHPKIVVLIAAALIAAIAVLPHVPVGFVGAVLILVFAFFFVAVTSRIVGIIGGSSCPVSGMTIATLLVCTLVLRWAGWEGMDGQIAALSVGAVVCIAIALAADTSQDLKTGFLVGATPNRQQIGEMIGVLTSAAFVGVTIYLLNNTYEIGSEEFPAPQASLVSMLIPGLFKGNLPWALVLIGCATALVVELLGVASLPFAVGLYLPIALTTPIMIGGAIHWLLVGRRKPPEVKTMLVTAGVLLGSGLIAGEGLVAVFLALLDNAGVALPPSDYAWLKPWVTCVAFALLALLFVRFDWKGPAGGVAVSGRTMPGE